MAIFKQLRAWLKRHKTACVLGGYFGFWLLYFAVFWWSAIKIDDQGHVVAGHLNIWGDWPVHFTMGSFMAYNQLFTTSSPLLLDAPFLYPFVCNFLPAVLIRMGVPFFTAFTLLSGVFSFGFVLALYFFYHRVFKSRRTALFASVVFLFNGGLGFIYYFKDVWEAAEPLKAIILPIQTYTRMDIFSIRWISVIDSMVIPQRSFQLGFPMALIILGVYFHFFIGENLRFQKHKLVLEWRQMFKIQVWLNNKSIIGLLLVAMIWGMLPIIHTHSFFAVGLILGCWVLGDFLSSPAEFIKNRMPLWILIFAVGLSIGGAWIYTYQLVGQSTINGMRWFPGWYAKENEINWFLFWVLNWGITPFIAFFGGGYWLRTEHRVQGWLKKTCFLLPFFLLFIGLNLFLFHAWVWDNTKYLVWVSLVVSGMAGYALSALSLKKFSLSPGLVYPLLCLSIFSGVLDNYRLLFPSLNQNRLYTKQELELVSWTKSNTNPASIWFTGDYHNNWLFNLTGRQSLYTYGWWMWSHGYQDFPINQDLRSMFEKPEQKKLFHQYGVDYILLGFFEPRDRNVEIAKFQDQFFSLKKSAPYEIFSTARRPPGMEKDGVILKNSVIKPAFPLDTPQIFKTGLTQTLYHGAFFAGKKSEVKSGMANLNFLYHGDEPRDFSSPVSMRWEGYLKIETPGIYTFTLESDDGAWLYLDQQLIVDNGGIHALQRSQNQIKLNPGYYPIQLLYFDFKGGAALKLLWKAPQGKEQEIPYEKLGQFTGG